MKTHYEPKMPKGTKIRWGAFCTRKTLPFTTSDKNRVTCENCLRMMKLHGHLEAA